ncbi:myosin-1-like [Zingiber officinale]|uniref:myosin-1-like n=1 Tax=Zingiber officinale TaxID=94328 RepID=UPI001C4D45E3|nr:myosin-1-like [Zingiber officinale]XP_042414455.1 myosin-1-like [Zingiber officinale]
MSSALPAVPTRSVLEEMLAALKLSDEKPKDEPPALPARPTLKRRPPSTKNNLKFKIESVPAEVSSKDTHFTEKASPESSELSNGVIEQGRAKKVVHSGEEDLGSHEEDTEKSHTSQKLDHVEQEMAAALRLEAIEKEVDDVKEELRGKEGENVALLQKVQEYQKRCSVCEEKMHSMEDMYQKQIQTLKMALDAAQKNLSVDDKAKQRMSDETPTTYRPVNDANDKSNNAVYQLAKEFEKQKQVFEDDARGLCNVKSSSGQPEFSRKSYEDLRKLKAQYATWKKEYNTRLHDAKKALRELAKSEGEKTSRRWWCKRRIIRNRISLCS